MKKNLKIGVLVCSILIIIGFFLPWVCVGSKQAGSFTKILTGKRQEGIAAISGFQIPVMANSDESRLIISVAKIFFPNVTDADKKSFLVWVIPILAMLILFLDRQYGNIRWVDLAYGVMGAMIFFVVTYKVMTTDLDKVVLQVGIGIGLWLILFGYLGMGISGINKFLVLSKK